MAWTLVLKPDSAHDLLQTLSMVSLDLSDKTGRGFIDFPNEKKAVYTKRRMGDTFSAVATITRSLEHQPRNNQTCPNRNRSWRKVGQSLSGIHHGETLTRSGKASSKDDDDDDEDGACEVELVYPPTTEFPDEEGKLATPWSVMEWVAGSQVSLKERG